MSDNYTPLPEHYNTPNEQTPLPDQELSKQVKTSYNPTGKGGFGDNPENINRNGRPKRKTLTELIHAKLDSTPDGWDKVVNLVLHHMFNKKDKDVLKELWHMTDGLPQQKTVSDIRVEVKQILGGKTHVIPGNNSDIQDIEPEKET